MLDSANSNLAGAASKLGSVNAPNERVGNSPATPNGRTNAADFKAALEGAVAAKAEVATKSAPAANVTSPLASSLANATATASLAKPISNLKFSNHAIERMHSRGISIAPEQMARIENAVDKAAQKGSKDTLVLSGDNALIVSVKNKTVVTIMDRAAMKDNVFTNIDSTVVI